MTTRIRFIFYFYQHDPELLIITHSHLLIITLIRSIFNFYQHDPDLLIHPGKVRLFPFNRHDHDLLYYVPWQGSSFSLQSTWSWSPILRTLTRFVFFPLIDLIMISYTTYPDKVRLFPFNRPDHDLICYIPWQGSSVSLSWPSVSHHHDSIHTSTLPTWPSISHHRDSIHLSPLPTWPSISHHPGNSHLSP